MAHSTGLDAYSIGLEPKQNVVEIMNSLTSELRSVRVHQEMQFDLLLQGQTRLHQGIDDVQEQLSQLGTSAQQSLTKAPPAVAQSPGPAELRTSYVGNGTTDETRTMKLSEAGVLGEMSGNLALSIQKDSLKLSAEMENQTELAFFHHHPLNFKIGEDFKPPPPSVTTNVVDPSWSYRICARIWDSPYFDYSSALLIITNAILLGVQTELSADRDPSVEEPFSFRVAERVFCVLFTIELMIRIYVLRFNFFGMSGWVWNMFDLFVVTTQWIEELFILVSVTLESGRGYDQGSKMQGFSVVRIIRILRLVRIIRLVRVMRFISELRTIIVSIFNTLRSLMWTLVLLFVMIYILAVCITQLVIEELASEEDAAQSDINRINPMSPTIAQPTQCKEDYDLNQLFGSIGRSVLSLFQVICGGLEWNRVVTPLMDKISPIMAFFFCLYVAFSLFALMNVVTGVFLESALKTSREDRDLVLLQRMKQALKQLDLDNSGMISWKRLKSKSSNPDMDQLFKSIDVDPREAQDLFMLIDIAEKGEVSTKDFLSGCIRLQGSASAVDMATFMHEYKRSQKRWTAQWKLLESSIIKIAMMFPTTNGEPFCEFSASPLSDLRLSDLCSPQDLSSPQQESQASSEYEPETAWTSHGSKFSNKHIYI